MLKALDGNLFSFAREFGNIDSFGSASNFLTYWVTYFVNYIGIFDCVSWQQVDENIWTVIIVLAFLSFWGDLLNAIRGKGKD